MSSDWLRVALSEILHSMAWKTKKLASRTFILNLVPRVSLLCLHSLWNRDPGCGWSRDHLSIQNRRVGEYSSTFGREDDEIPHPCSRFFYLPDSRWSRDQPQPVFQRLRRQRRETLGTRLVYSWAARDVIIF